MSNVISPKDAEPVAESSSGINFALVLSRMIDSVEQDPVQLRTLVYELARIKLQEQIDPEDDQEAKRLVGALEDAISGVERFSLQEQATRQSLALPSPDRTEALSDRRSGRAKKKTNQDSRSELQGKSVRATISRGWPRAMENWRSGTFANIVRLGAILVIALSVGLGVAVWPRLKSFNQASVPNIKVVTNLDEGRAPPPPPAETVDAAPVAKLDYPLPSTFGIYALVDQQLYELKPLAGKIPDRRVAMSAAINGASQTSLANGAARFIVFRRDAATNAPDNAEVRVIAKVKRAMGVDPSGKAAMVPSDNWVIRNISLPYKTGPIPDHPEMYLIQPDSIEATLPSGRYALVIKGQGFDFAVDGAVTDARQCVERVDAVNGAFYTPCPDKR